MTEETVIPYDEATAVAAEPQPNPVPASDTGRAAPMLNETIISEQMSKTGEVLPPGHPAPGGFEPPTQDAAGFPNATASEQPYPLVDSASRPTDLEPVVAVAGQDEEMTAHNEGVAPSDVKYFRAWFRQDLAWVLKEMDLRRVGHTAEACADLNP